MPTFHFYRNSILIEEFSGADQQKLTDTLNRLVPVDESKSESECPYKHFPLRLEELTSFDKVKFDIIREKLVEFSSQVPDEIRLDSKCVCDGDGITVLDEIISALSDRTRYHSSKLETRHFSLISTLLSWPTNFLPPILNLIRIAAFHPCFSSFIVSQNSSSSKGTDFLSRVLSIAKTSENDICTLVLVRTICNMFSRLTLSHLLVTRIDDVLDAFNSCCSSSKKLALRLAYACLLINYSIAFMHQHASAEDIVLPAKIQILSCASELLSQSPQNVSKLVYRVLVIVGTLVFRDSMTKSMAVTLEFPETVKTLAKVNASDERIVQVCEELQQALAATTQ